MKTATWTLSVQAALLLAVTAAVPWARAQDTIQDDTNGTCPQGYSLVTVTNNPKDKNGNGRICQAAPARKDRAGSSAQTFKDDKDGSCPPGFSLVTAADHPKDRNGNGKVCQAASEPRSKAGSKNSAPQVVDDVNGTCPPGYFLKVLEGPRVPDRNGNGKVCVRR